MMRITPFSVSTDWAGQTLPLFACAVPAGFPSPADDHLDAPINLHEMLFTHPASTFLARVSGDSMTGAGIRHDDIIAVDRALQPQDGSIVVAVLDGEHTVKRLRRLGDQTWLEPDNPRYPIIRLTEGCQLVIFGVVTHVIHSFRDRKARPVPPAAKPRKRP
ncbi:translesion error-prone DNA polymerase V autoproteolytic subunit [Hymenobacter sp. 15J16-1T3B]|uniref:LexA family protein n=1 Tax=Hymenobacter sp. 15J16-1T3B TaxID=2886941 RepID=UPI001D123D36|nr:translesion error-prone DNA polymerase V autoproteolytic subunit [Hymenobacter sp. 15J16-1T3B]MCC3160774.1 translesion error-prone DNA polymerase V autoproteolytic subunit [Hymenobacter sp. 15J16-1T3B]